MELASFSGLGMGLGWNGIRYSLSESESGIDIGIGMRLVYYTVCGDTNLGTGIRPVIRQCY